MADTRKINFFFKKFNNFILRWYCTIAEANKNQPLITINMLIFKFFYLCHVEADTKEHVLQVQKKVMTIMNIIIRCQ